MGYAEQLGVEPAEMDDVLEHFQRASYGGSEYRHLPDERHGIERGTALVDGVVVRGFPKIPRTLFLRTGIPRYFDGPLAVEEKLNGYNVRIADVGELRAFTRGGYVCPYTTRLAETALDVAPFFAAHPDLMLCGEVIGHENPYTVHQYPEIESLAFRAFDVRDRTSGAPLPVEERRELCDAYDIPQVALLGRYEPDRAVGAVPDLVRDLDDQDREGIVMKSLDGTRQLKYTTSSANQGSLAFAFSLPFDYGREFVFRRIIREAFQAVEWDEDDAALRDRAHELGESILLPAVETLRDVERERSVGERHTVRDDPAAVEALLAHLDDMGLTVVIETDRTEDGERTVTFVKRAASTTDKARNYLDGHTVNY